MSIGCTESGGSLFLSVVINLPLGFNSAAGNTYALSFIHKTSPRVYYCETVSLTCQAFNKVPSITASQPAQPWLPPQARREPSCPELCDQPPPDRHANSRCAAPPRAQAAWPDPLAAWRTPHNRDRARSRGDRMRCTSAIPASARPARASAPSSSRPKRRPTPTRSSSCRTTAYCPRASPRRLSST